MRVLSLVSVFVLMPVWAYRVVLDPGHGGRDLVPHSAYGDKYDRRLNYYLDKFREGARHRGIWEFEVMYDIAAKAKALLDATQSESGKKQFAAILSRYGQPMAEIPAIEAFLSRPPGYTENYFQIREDLNAPFRLYDYPDWRTGEIQPGTISRINALAPELVVTLHLTHTEAPKQGAMATVITPAFRTYALALRYAADPAQRNQLKAQFLRSPWRNWFISDNRYKKFGSFLADAAIYFIGFWTLPESSETDFSRFRGYRQNLVRWVYADRDEKVEELYGQKNERYATTLADFTPAGAFWEREQGEPEKWRREDGPEGFGGDNHYAGMEVLRYIRKAFLIHGIDTPKTAAKIIEPYISTWAVPTYTNAIAAFVEIAHTTSRRDHMRMARYRHVYAEAVAVAVYSLLYGLPQKTGDLLPRGKPLNLKRYENLAGGNYFRRVSQN
ncbi:MAG: hypothetical protein N2Z22_03105 [Turneriella sp.]|nr:hypothetical protein [Turneriella sp.]